VSVEVGPSQDRAENSKIRLRRAKLFFSKDSPTFGVRHPSAEQNAFMLELLYRYAPEGDILKKILVDNPAKLFGFPHL
jgi:hypothetical protein